MSKSAALRLKQLCSFCLQLRSHSIESKRRKTVLSRSRRASLADPERAHFTLLSRFYPPAVLSRCGRRFSFRPDHSPQRSHDRKGVVVCPAWWGGLQPKTPNKPHVAFRSACGARFSVQRRHSCRRPANPAPLRRAGFSWAREPAAAGSLGFGFAGLKRPAQAECLPRQPWPQLPRQPCYRPTSSPSKPDAPSNRRPASWLE